MNIKRINRIWIELDAPTDKADAEKQCELANNMLKRLNPTTGMEFWWSEREHQYCLNLDTAGSYISLTDRGHWLNLDYIGRPVDVISPASTGAEFEAMLREVLPIAQEAIEARLASEDPEDHETVDLLQASVTKAQALIDNLGPL